MRHLPVWALVLVLLCASAAGAAELQLNPLRLTLSAARAIDAFRLSNAGVKPARVQVTIKAWSQGEDGDRFADTADIISNPPMFQIPGEATQTIRVGLRDTKPGPVERAYRVFFQEVPDQAGSAIGIRTLLRISVPVFVPPAEPRPAALEFALRPAKQGKALEIRNTGNVHVQITHLTVSDASGPVSSTGLSLYVLPGDSVRWQPEKPGFVWPPGARISAETDQGPIAASHADATSSP